MDNEKLSIKEFLIILFIIIFIIGFIIIVFAGGQKKSEHLELESSVSVVIDTKSIEVVEPTTEEITEVEEETAEIQTKSNKEVAKDVINGLYGNGEERYKKLKEEGYDPDKIQAIVDKKMAKVTPTVTAQPEYYESNNNDNVNYDYSSGVLNPYVGVVFFNGHKETYYSQKVLPGGGLNIPGRHVAEDGTIRDGDGYICVAADPSYLPYGAIVETSLGTGKVYDSGCDYGTIDIYTNW